MGDYILIILEVKEERIRENCEIFPTPSIKFAI